jgi:hypothetical protein
MSRKRELVIHSTKATAATAPTGIESCATRNLRIDSSAVADQHVEIGHA